MCTGTYEVIGKATDKDWLERRRSGIGASEIGCVLGVSSFMSPYQLWAEKTGLREARDFSDNEPIEWGKRLEPLIVAAYGERSGRPVQPSGELLRSREHRWALCTLDARTGIEAPEWPLEIKTTSAFKAEDWVDGPPDIYNAQIHAQMLVCGAQRATIAVLLGGQRLLWSDVERDERLVRKIIHHGAEFWRRVEERDPPEVDGSDGTARALAELFAEDDGGAIELPAELREVVDELDTLRKEAVARDKRKKLLENRLKASLGRASVGVFPGGLSVSLKKQTRKAQQIAEASFRVLRIHQPK